LQAGSARQRSRARVQEAFTNADRGVAGTYLRQLVERIVVEPEEVVVEAKAAEVIAMMATSGSMGATDAGTRARRTTPAPPLRRRTP
jgi:hypothetical protein